MAAEAEVRGALAQVQDPGLGRSIIDLGMVRDLKIPELTPVTVPPKTKIYEHQGA
jgi:metal-sulfur cluster biosynthetic enzyme